MTPECAAYLARDAKDRAREKAVDVRNNARDAILLSLRTQDWEGYAGASSPCPPKGALGDRATGTYTKLGPRNRFDRCGVRDPRSPDYDERAFVPKVAKPKGKAAKGNGRKLTGDELAARKLELEARYGTTD